MKTINRCIKFTMSIVIPAIIWLCNPILLAQDKGNQVIPLDSLFGSYFNTRDFTINRNESEAFFTVQSPGQEISQIVSITKVNNKWTEPRLMPFCNQFKYLEPFLSADETRLYFVSDRPKSEEDDKRSNFNIWFVERKSTIDKWSEPKLLIIPVKADQDIFYPTFSLNGNLYFTMESQDGMGKDDIYYCQKKGDEFENPILLDSNINSSGYEFNAFISRDERFILFTKYNAPDGKGSGDLYISRKNSEDQWQKAENLNAEINTNQMEYCPYYNQYSSTLYFTSKRNSIQQRSFATMHDCIHHIQQSENGLSKIYKVSIYLE